jgi:hypothetical protein
VLVVVGGGSCKRAGGEASEREREREQGTQVGAAVQWLFTGVPQQEYEAAVCATMKRSSGKEEGVAHQDGREEVEEDHCGDDDNDDEDQFSYSSITLLKDGNRSVQNSEGEAKQEISRQNLAIYAGRAQNFMACWANEEGKEPVNLDEEENREGRREEDCTTSSELSDELSLMNMHLLPCDMEEAVVGAVPLSPVVGLAPALDLQNGKSRGKLTGGISSADTLAEMELKFQLKYGHECTEQDSASPNGRCSVFDRKCPSRVTAPSP